MEVTALLQLKATPTYYYVPELLTPMTAQISPGPTFPLTPFSISSLAMPGERIVEYWRSLKTSVV